MEMSRTSMILDQNWPTNNRGVSEGPHPGVKRTQVGVARASSIGGNRPIQAPIGKVGFPTRLCKNAKLDAERRIYFFIL